MKTSTFAVVTAGVLVAGVCSGCATGTSANNTVTEYDGAGTLSGTLSISGFTSTTDEVASTRYALALDALGDGVTAKSDESGFDMQTFLAAVAGNSAPDLVYVDRAMIGTLAAKNAIEPLADCMAGESIDAGVYRSTAMDQVTLNGDVFGIPEFNTADVVIANTTLLEHAGLTLNDVDGSNWAGVAAAARQMTDVSAGDVKVLGFDTKMPEFFPLWAKANGVDILSEDGRTANLNDPKVVEAVQFATGVYDDEGGYSAIKAAKDASDFFGSENQYATDTLGAMPMEQWYVNVLADVSPDAPIDFTTFKDTGGSTISYATGSAWAIPAGSSNKQAACRFAKTMTATDTWVAAAQARIDEYAGAGAVFTGLLTANSEADEKVREMVDSPDGTLKNAIDAIYEANDVGFALAANPADSEFKSAWTDAINRVLTGEASPQESLDRAQSEAQDALDAAWADFGDN